MSDLSLIDIVNLIRAEIARTEIGDVKKITGPTGEQGPMGDTGPQGPAGPRGNDGKQGPAGSKGDQGKKGDKGIKGSDGDDGVGIARVDQDSVDGSIVVYLTDGNSYTIEMPLIDNDGNLAKEVHFKSGGGGGGGIVDLSGYVRRPSNTHDGKWLLYREADSTNQGEWTPATTDLIETNGMIMFRDINGRFSPTPEELGELTNQLKVNRFMWERIQGLDGDGYVKKEGGDEMEGPLTILAQDGADGRATKRVETLGVFSNSDQSALRLGTTRDRVYVGHNDTSFNGPIKVDEIQEKNAGGGVQITDRVILKTEGVEDDEAVTKKYIDDVARHLQDEIVELEEEIDAIAPSVERGKWSFTAVGTVAQPGQFTMYDADFGNGSPTGLFKSARSIWFNELDLDGTPHSFANVEDGELLEIFIDGSPEYGLFSVTGEAHDETPTGSKFWVVDVDFVRTNEATTAVGPGEICRFKIFEAPSGGDATSFVMKSGDTMSGKLQLDKARGDNDNGDGFTVKGAISDSYSSSSNINQNGNLLQVNHIARNPDEINYLGRIRTGKNIVTKEYVNDLISAIPTPESSGSPVLLHSGSGYSYKFVDNGVLSSTQFSSDSTFSSLSYLYLSKLWGQKRGWTQVVNYDCTENSTVEIWQATSDMPLLIIRAGINSIEQAEWTQHDAKLTLNRFWHKPGYSLSKYNDYTFMIHGLVERPELISPLSYSKGETDAIPADKLSNVGETIAVPDEGEE